MTPTTGSTTDRAALRELVYEVLGTIVPEGDVRAIETDDSIQDQLDIDSIDFLNFVMAVHERTGVDIAERDYPKVATIDGCVAYLEAKTG